MQTSPSIRFADRDDFRREVIADSIIRLLNSDYDISPIVIDGNWGEGKTEFCFKLKNKLEEQGERCAYFDCFKSDHLSDPLLAIFTAISAALNNEYDAKRLREKILPVVSFGIKTIGKAGISWALRQDSDNIAEEFEQAIVSAGDALLGIAAKQLEKEEEYLSALITLLEELTSESKIHVFIDELDRCKPSYAVELLEKIKHVFTVPNVRFVLVSNTNQLKASINHLYGQDVVADQYLQKFVGVVVKLNSQTVVPGNSIFNSAIHFKNHTSQYPQLMALSNEQNVNNRIATYIVVAARLSLRQTEYLVRKLLIFAVANNISFDRMDSVTGGIAISVVFLDTFCPDVLKEIENDRFDADKIISSLNLPDLGDETVTNIVKQLTAVNLLVGESSRPPPEELDAFRNHIERIASEGPSNWYRHGIESDLKIRYAMLIRALRFDTIQ